MCLFFIPKQLTIKQQVHSRQLLRVTQQRFRHIVAIKLKHRHTVVIIVSVEQEQFDIIAELVTK